MNQSRYFFRFLTIILLAGAWGILPGNLYAAQQNVMQQEPVVTEQLFASPDEAVKALQEAVKAKDPVLLGKIFGAQVQDILTRDKVLDGNNEQKFASVMAQGYALVKEGDDKIILEVGTNNWPMPIPLVKTGGSWYFDTAAGKDEIMNRHIGKDELYAIGVCRAYVAAQRQYAKMNLKAGGVPTYAQRFKSTPGKKDGLYWSTAENEPDSPFGPLVAEAYVEGYIKKSFHPFHGYFFKIMTAQGKAAPGGRMNYMDHGNLTGGFALVAYPQHWGQSGIMTFIVNQGAQVFQRNLGEKTFQIAGMMKEYNPDNKWTLVEDEGEWSAVSEK